MGDVKDKPLIPVGIGVLHKTTHRIFISQWLFGHRFTPVVRVHPIVSHRIKISGEQCPYKLV